EDAGPAAGRSSAAARRGSPPGNSASRKEYSSFLTLFSSDGRTNIPSSGSPEVFVKESTPGLNTDSPDSSSRAVRIDRNGFFAVDGTAVTARANTGNPGASMVSRPPGPIV